MGSYKDFINQKVRIEGEESLNYEASCKFTEKNKYRIMIAESYIQKIVKPLWVVTNEYKII